MTNALTHLMEWLVRAIDWPLGWLLWLPRDIALFLFATATALLMTLARRALTYQDLLHRCSADLRRLKSFMRDAKSSGDQQWLRRLRSTAGLIKGMQLAADLRVLVVVLIPIGILAIWASERFDYLPPRVGTDLLVRATYPVSSIDRVTHLVPSPGLNLKSTAIQIVQSDGNLPPQGIADWTICPSTAGEFDLTIRHQRETAVHRLSVGRATYAAPVQQHPRERLPQTTVVLKQYLPLGSYLGSQWLRLPPWMLGYLILTLVLVPVLKRVLRVA